MTHRRLWAAAVLCVLSAPAPGWAQAEKEQKERAAPPTVSPSAVTVTVALTGTPLTGTCGYTMNLSWTAQNASVCTKSGAWSGSGAPASGSEQVQVTAAQQTYTLQCSSNTDSRNITWVNPTQNTDGTNVSLSGNKVYHANSAANIETGAPIVLTPARTTYLLSGLPAGPRYVGLKATGSTGLDSAMSNLANVTITLPVGSDSVQATCTPPPEPKPPTGVTIASAVWERLNTGAGVKVGRDVGTIGLDVQCLGTEAVLLQGTVEYWAVPRDLVTLYRKPKSVMLLGQCELRQPPA
jgi:hypothetical protein